MNRTPIAAVGIAFLAAGCVDLGLDGNIPAEQARTMPPPELVAEVMAPAPETRVPLVVDGRLWVPTGVPTTRALAELRPIGSTAGHTVYARAWDDRPFSAIFTRVLVPDAAAATSARAAMLAGQDHWQEYAPASGGSGRSAPTGRFRTEPISPDQPGLTPGPATEEQTGAHPLEADPEEPDAGEPGHGEPAPQTPQPQAPQPQ